MLKSLNVLKLNKEATLPTRAHSTDVGFDLYALKDVFLRLGKTTKVPTGVAVDLPEGYLLEIKDRSSMAIKGLRTGAGIIDPGYQGDITVVMHNISSDYDHDFYGYAGYEIKAGDRIAQFIITKVELPELVLEETFEETTDRGDQGYGSSGK